MTKSEAIKKVVSTAESYIGYLEKESGKDLDSFTGNIGNKNYTKFARDFFPELQGLEWCCMFVYSMFAYSFGAIPAQNILSGCKTAKCSVLYDAMRKNSKVSKQPKIGDLIFFHKNNNINHIGIVSNVSGDSVETIEGNTSVGNNVVIESGGGVYKKHYNLSNPRIFGFGEPTWSIVSNGSNDEAVTNDSDDYNAYINSNGVNIRSGAGTNFEKRFMVNKGYRIKIIGSAYNGSEIWYKFEANNEINYVRHDLVTLK